MIIWEAYLILNKPGHLPLQLVQNTPTIYSKTKYLKKNPEMSKEADESFIDSFKDDYGDFKYSPQMITATNMLKLIE